MRVAVFNALWRHKTSKRALAVSPNYHSARSTDILLSDACVVLVHHFFHDPFESTAFCNKMSRFYSPFIHVGIGKTLHGLAAMVFSKYASKYYHEMPKNFGKTCQSVYKQVNASPPMCNTTLPLPVLQELTIFRKFLY